jgi:hypothetical protein
LKYYITLSIRLFSKRGECNLCFRSKKLHAGGYQVPLSV